MASGVGSGKAKPMQTPIRNTGFNSKKNILVLIRILALPYCILSSKISYRVWGDPERRQHSRVKRAACCRAVPWAGRPGRPRGGGVGRWRPAGPVPPRPQTAAQRRLRPPPSARPTVHLLAKSPYGTIHMKTPAISEELILPVLHGIFMPELPAFQVNPDPGFWWPKTKEKKMQMTFFFIKKKCSWHFLQSFFDQKFNLLMSKLQEKPSALKREHPALKKMKFMNFFYACGSFFPSWIRIRIANPDPDPQHWIVPN